jgi:hypothetical protein
MSRLQKEACFARIKVTIWLGMSRENFGLLSCTPVNTFAAKESEL